MRNTQLTIGIAAAALALGLFMARASHAQKGEHAGHRMGMGDMSKMPMHASMERMSKVKSTLQKARDAAQAEGNDTVVAGIDEALELIEQNHKAMHKHMAAMMQKMKGRMDTMHAMADRMEEMKAEMAESGASQQMQKNMQQMREKMQKMHQGMKADAKQCDMMCPMCEKKMAGGEPEVVNSVCPIMGGKVDRENVPDGLTREFNGKKVGFCCASCPKAWDKLSDVAKKEKLAEALKKSGDEDAGKHAEHHGD